MSITLPPTNSLSTRTFQSMGILHLVNRDQQTLKTEADWSPTERDQTRKRLDPQGNRRRQEDVSPGTPVGVFVFLTNWMKGRHCPRDEGSKSTHTRQLGARSDPASQSSISASRPNDKEMHRTPH